MTTFQLFYFYSGIKKDTNDNWEKYYWKFIWLGMYKLIFYFFYRYFLYRSDDSPKFGAICGSFLTIGLHIILTYVIVQKIVGHNLLNPFSQTYFWNKILNILVILPFFILAILFFRKRRVDNIINEYDGKENVFFFLIGSFLYYWQ